MFFALNGENSSDYAFVRFARSEHPAEAKRGIFVGHVHGFGQ